MQIPTTAAGILTQAQHEGTAKPPFATLITTNSNSGQPNTNPAILKPRPQ